MKTCPKCGKLYDNSVEVCPDDSATLFQAATASFSPTQGSLLAGRYRIAEKIGEGGMGAIYKAVHTMMDRTCAIKLLTNLSASDESAVARFNREAKMASRINNPHAVTIYDFGAAEGGMLYLAMEFIDGRPLSKILEEEKKLPVARVVQIVNQIGEALRAAHDLEIIHRDLKPDNIMICDRTEGDYVKVLDFGIAKTVADDSGDNLTKTGFILGTPVYMSPEQLSGDRLDPRSDVYSLALIAYQMLSGRLPFEGDNPQAIMVKRLMTDPIPLRVAEPTALDSVERAVMSGLARDREARTPNAERFAKELSDAVMAGTQVMGSRATSKLADQGGTSYAAGPSLYQTRPDTPVDRSGVRGETMPFESASVVTNPTAAQHTSERSVSVAGSVPLSVQEGRASLIAQQPVQLQQEIVAVPPRRSSMKLWLIVGVVAVLVAGGLFYAMWPSGFTLVVTGAPAGSEVFVNNKSRGKTSADGTLTITGLEPGAIALRVSHEEFSEFEASLTGEKGKEGSLVAEMLPLEIDYHGKMVLVPAGDFIMGNDEGDPDERPARTLHLPAYYIDKFEVNNAQYKEFADKNMFPYPDNPRSFPDYFTKHLNSPVLGINWDAAVAFAGSVGKQLPTEEEWEKAASWDPATKSKRKWPWGNMPELGRAHLGVNSPGPSPVDQYPRDISAYGVIGMGGNVNEWVNAYYQPYEGSKASDERFGEIYRVTRGGCLLFKTIEKARTTMRRPEKPDDPGNVRATGIRCVVSANDREIQPLLRGRTK